MKTPGSPPARGRWEDSPGTAFQLYRIDTMPPPPTYFALMRHALSDARLDAYRAGTTDGDLDLLARYAWNTALSAALYPSLQGIEVALRNTLDAAVARIGGPSWFDLQTILVEPWAQGKVIEAKQKLARQRKPIEPGRVVAELDFGFWTSLLNVAYEQGPNRLPTQGPLWPRLLPVAFPHAGPRFVAATAYLLDSMPSATCAIGFRTTSPSGVDGAPQTEDGSTLPLNMQRCSMRWAGSAQSYGRPSCSTIHSRQSTGSGWRRSANG